MSNSVLTLFCHHLRLLGMNLNMSRARQPRLCEDQEEEGMTGLLGALGLGLVEEKLYP